MNTMLSNIGTKLQIGAAACALAGTAALTSGAVASASPTVPLPAAGLGSSAAALCDEADEECLSPFAAASANATGGGPFENNFLWVGPIPDDLPDNIAVFEYNLINAFPSEATREQMYSWWESVLPDGFQACVLGATYRLDSYSTMTVGLTRGCTG